MYLQYINIIFFFRIIKVVPRQGCPERGSWGGQSLPNQNTSRKFEVSIGKSRKLITFLNTTRNFSYLVSKIRIKFIFFSRHMPPPPHKQFHQDGLYQSLGRIHLLYYNYHEILLQVQIPDINSMVKIQKYKYCKRSNENFK